MKQPTKYQIVMGRRIPVKEEDQTPTAQLSRKQPDLESEREPYDEGLGGDPGFRPYREN